MGVKKRKLLTPFEIVVIPLGLLLCSIVAARLGSAYSAIQSLGLKGEEFYISIFREISSYPLKFTFDDNVVSMLIFTFSLYAVLTFYYYMNKKNLMPGEEHGSAQWAGKHEADLISSEKEEENIILTETERMSLDTRKTRKNLNVMVIGGSGSGKTRFFVKPNLMQHNTSYVITDPKGELLKSTAPMLEANGYKIKVFNLIDMAHSSAYNPFAYIKDDKDVMKMINILIKNTTPSTARSGDPFWEKSETALLQALCYYLYYEAPYEEQNFSMVMELLRSAEVRESDESYESDLDLLFNHLKEKNPDHIALKQYSIFKQAAGQTAKSILVSVGVRMASFNTRNIAALTITDNIRLEELGLEKTALFVVVPDSHDTFNFLVAMMYSQIFDSLYYLADNDYGGRLPVHVRFLLDEFANIGQIPEFDKMVATMRSREISVSIILQNLAQIKANYKETWESITGNCDSLLFLGGQEQSTLEYISKRLGKATIDLRTTGESHGKSKSNSVNFGLHGRELLTPDEISRMSDQNCILMVRGLKPFFSNKFDIKKHKEYPKLNDTDTGSGYVYSGIDTPFDVLDDFFREYA